MTCFPDVNVWLALLLDVHTHHRIAQAWIDQSDFDRLAFCRVTQMGLLRLLTNPTVMKADVRTIHAAWQALEKIMSNEQIVFVPEPPGVENSWKKLTATQKAGPNYWTDSYLAAFASRTGHTLVTFDRGFQKFAGLPVRIIGIPAPDPHHYGNS